MHIDFRLTRPARRLDLNVDLQGFQGNDFDLGTSFFRSTFVGGRRKMTVDGVDLTRTQ